MAAIDRYYLLDLDRTLLDTAKVFAVFQQYLAERSVEHRALTELLSQESQQLEATGYSFDAGDWLEEKLGAVETDELLQDFISQLKTSSEIFLNDGATELIKSVEGQYGIMTTGGKTWQEMKLRLVGLDGQPHMITSRKDKGQLIGEWARQPDGAWRLPEAFDELVVRQLILVDDKAAVFAGLPESIQGYWYCPSGDQLVSQSGSVPGNVDTIRQLSDVVDRERQAEIRS